MACESVVMPLASSLSVRTAEAITSPARALVGLSVVSGFGITESNSMKRGGGRPADGD
jgi:hypothetical protein